jgi:hypothetical protein
MPKVRNLNYDGVGFNASWVASFKTEKQFLSQRGDIDHLFPGKTPEGRVAALKEVYALSVELIRPGTKPVVEEPKGGE